MENNELNRDMLSRRMERKGFEVLMAADGADKLAGRARSAAARTIVVMGLLLRHGWASMP